jgi:hypothetical protein
MLRQQPYRPGVRITVQFCGLGHPTRPHDTNAQQAWEQRRRTRIPADARAETGTDRAQAAISTIGFTGLQDMAPKNRL